MHPSRRPATDSLRARTTPLAAAPREHVDGELPAGYASAVVLREPNGTDDASQTCGIGGDGEEHGFHGCDACRGSVQSNLAFMTHGASAHNYPRPPFPWP